jgi:hypothetical protein
MGVCFAAPRSASLSGTTHREMAASANQPGSHEAPRIEQIPPYRFLMPFDRYITFLTPAPGTPFACRGRLGRAWGCKHFPHHPGTLHFHHFTTPTVHLRTFAFFPSARPISGGRDGST